MNEFIIHFKNNIYSTIVEADEIIVYNNNIALAINNKIVAVYPSLEVTIIKKDLKRKAEIL